MFERLVEFEPAYDKRDPDPKKSYGIHGVTIRFVLKGRKGAVHFMLFTDWYPPNVQQEHANDPDFWGIRTGLSRLKPNGVDVGYHSPIQRHDDQSPGPPCPYVDDVPCYYDGSSLRADDWVTHILLPKGSNGVWVALEAEYEAIFAEDPEPPEPWQIALEETDLTPEQKERVRAKMEAAIQANHEAFVRRRDRELEQLAAAFLPKLTEEAP